MMGTRPLLLIFLFVLPVTERAHAQTGSESGQPAASTSPSSADAQTPSNDSTPLITSETGDIDFSNITPERLQSMRDPFKAPELSVVMSDLPELEKLSLENYELVGVMMGPKRVRAMVRTPERKMFLVAEGTRLGNRSGVIIKVTPSSLKVREKFVNVFGKEETQDSTIQLYKEEKRR
jgi:hypothetical protein